MKVHTGTIGSMLNRTQSKKNARSRRTAGQEADTTSWNTHRVALENLATLLPFSLRSPQSDDRAAHIEELHMQVAAGIYKIDSALLAKSMLTDQTHFLDEDAIAHTNESRD
jgi:anti-sigma28 factor (negative regulator of flagellin synthesis)